MTRSQSSSADRQAVAVVCAAMVVSAALILFLGRDLYFYSDELDWLTVGGDFSPGTLLLPHNGHLLALVRFIYEALPRIFGTAYLPFRLLALTSLLSCAALLFVLARRRIGSPAAVIPTIIFLFFGSAGEIMLSAIALPFTLSIAFGLASLAAIEKDTRSWDLIAMSMLVLAVLSHTFGSIFAVGLAVYVLSTSEYRRIWVAAVPLALYVAWWVWALRFGEGLASSSNIGGAALFVIESAASSLAAILGVGHAGFGDGASWIERLIGFGSVGLVIACCALVVMRFRSNATPWLLACLAIILAFWVGTALSANDARQPDTPRYLFFDAVMILLIATECLRGIRLARPILSAVVLVAVLSTLANAGRMVRTGDDLTDEVDEVRTQIAMVELAGDRAPADFTPSSVVPRGSEHVTVLASRLIGFSADTGSLGFDLDQVRDQSEGVREGADFVLARAIGLAATPAGRLDRLAGKCTLFEPEVSGGVVDVPLVAGSNSIRLPPSSVGQPLQVGRFADAATVPVGVLAPGGAVDLPLIGDAAPEPWFAQVAGAVRLCAS